MIYLYLGELGPALQNCTAPADQLKDADANDQTDHNRRGWGRWTFSRPVGAKPPDLPRFLIAE